MGAWSKESGVPIRVSGLGVALCCKVGIMEAMKQRSQELLHDISLNLAKVYHITKLSDPNTDLQPIMDAYVETRRAIPKGEDGTRYGHAEAYKVMTLGPPFEVRF